MSSRVQSYLERRLIVRRWPPQRRTVRLDRVLRRSPANGAISHGKSRHWKRNRVEWARTFQTETLPSAETLLPTAETLPTDSPDWNGPISSVVAAMQAEQRRPEEQRPVPIMAIHSTNDCTVHALASENIRDSWIRRYGLSRSPSGTLDCQHEGVRCTHVKYGPTQRSVVETVLYEGERGSGFSGSGTHYWVGDNSGQFANPRGPSASELLWSFFKNHPFAETEPPSVSISSAASSGRSIAISGSASSVGSTIVEVAVRLEGRFPQGQRVASGTTSWMIKFDNVSDNATYIPVASAKDNDGRSISVTGQPVSVGSPPPNRAPELTLDARASGSCILVTGTAFDPEGQLAKVEVEVGRGALSPRS